MDINRQVTDYVDELDRKIAKKNEGNSLSGGTDVNERDLDEGTGKKKIVFGLIEVITMVVVAVIICFIIVSLLYKAKLRKKYFGSYGSITKRNRKCFFRKKSG